LTRYRPRDSKSLKRQAHVCVLIKSWRDEAMGEKWYVDEDEAYAWNAVFELATIAMNEWVVSVDGSVIHFTPF
jgi:hypothetical protein